MLLAILLKQFNGAKYISSIAKSIKGLTSHQIKIIQKYLRKTVNY